jgi:hypothetical protein
MSAPNEETNRPAPPEPDAPAQAGPRRDDDHPGVDVADPSSAPESGQYEPDDWNFHDDYSI